MKSSPRSAMHLRLFVLFAAVSLAILPALPQRIDNTQGVTPIPELVGPWRFHAGDDPIWSSAAVDELLGFERTRSLSTSPARDVALAAQSFGQEDDITVLTLSMSSETVAA